MSVNPCREIPLGNMEASALDAPQLYRIRVFNKELTLFTIPSYIDNFMSFFENLSEYKYERCKSKLILDVLGYDYILSPEKFETSKSLFKRTLDILESDPVFKELIRLNDLRLSRDENIDNLLDM